MSTKLHTVLGPTQAAPAAVPKEQGALACPVDALATFSPGIYLLEQQQEHLLVWRVTGEEPDEATLLPIPLWPLLLPEVA